MHQGLEDGTFAQAPEPLRITVMPWFRSNIREMNIRVLCGSARNESLYAFPLPIRGNYPDLMIACDCGEPRPTYGHFGTAIGIAGVCRDQHFQPPHFKV